MREHRRKLTWIGLGLLVMLLVMLGNGMRSLSLFPSAAAATARHYTQLEFSPPPEVKLPAYERYQLDNGMVVYLVENHELPLVKGNAIIRTGSRYEPAQKVGLAELVGTVMRTGGTQQHSPDELNQLLEQQAAFVETGIGTTSGGASFDALSEDLETVFGLFAEVLRQPAFDPEQLALAKSRRAGAIARRNDDPNDIAGREFNKLLYGEDSPYARTVEYATLNNITREDVVGFYNTYVRPDHIILGIVGDFEPQAMKALIEQAFGDWQTNGSALEVSLPRVTQAQTEGVFFVEQPQLTQSSIRLGHLDGQLDNPDYPALQVITGVLNGFGGRLFNEVRSRQGLAYSVFGVWRANYDYPGVFVAGGQTQSETTVAMIESLRSQIEQLRTTPISPGELSYAKNSMLNSFVFNFQDPAQTLSRLMRYEYYGYPEDFIFQFQQGVKATTAEDVLRVAQTYLKPDQMVTLVVGNSEQIQPPLSRLHEKVTALDISIPEPTS